QRVRRRVAQMFSPCCFLWARIDERIPLQKLTGEDRNEGAPRVGVTRGVFAYAEGVAAHLRTGPLSFSHFQLLPASAATQRQASAKPLRPRARQDSRALQDLPRRLRGHARACSSAPQRNGRVHTVAHSKSTQAARLEGPGEKEAPCARRSAPLRVFSRGLRTSDGSSSVSGSAMCKTTFSTHETSGSDRWCWNGCMV